MWPCSEVSPVHWIKVERMSSSLRLLRNKEARVGSRSFEGKCLSVLAEPEPELLWRLSKLMRLAMSSPAWDHWLSA